MTEAIYDDSIFVSHFSEITRSAMSEALAVATADMRAGVHGPFLWWREYSFPKCLEIYTPGAKPLRRKAAREGRPCEVEIYECIDARRNARRRIEVWYDPSIGFLPRYGRILTVGQSETTVDEMTLMAAHSCVEGGFVPTEWCRRLFSVKDFEKRYAIYDICSIDMSPAARSKTARNVLRLWQQSGNDFQAGDYTQVVWERSLEAEKKGNSIDASDLPDL
jgi:hypothetical protein